MFTALDIKRDWHWAVPRLGCRVSEDTQGIVSFNERGNYDAMCVMDSWTPNAVQVHLVIENPFVIRTGFLHAIAHHVYVTGGRGIMLGAVPANNAKALKFDKHIGFTEVCRIKDAYDVGVDIVLLEMRRETCRWLNDGFIQEHTRAA